VDADPTLPAGPAPVALAAGALLGRYIVLGQLGGGGMGVVYAAYDPQLDRKVAVKLLRPDAGGGDASEGRARLLREGQAMARLAHPNVIAVHDVGTFEDQVFVAMEFVEGQTLAAWVKTPRPWRDAVATFAQAGRGLAAAHAAGLVHRDFKPDNVLVGRDGRVRVLDFGLARAADAAAVNDPGLPASPSSLAPLTQPGAILGTPAYMSPEQFAGRLADARSDQFSFCVSLYEALFGERPFGGDTLAALRDAVAGGVVRPAPQGTRVPAWLRAVVVRGLSKQPNERHPSMDALLTALAHDPGVARRRRLVVAAAAVLIAGAALGWRHLSREHELLCRGAERKLAGIWDEAARAKVHDAFATCQQPFAQDAFRGVGTALDQYARAWVAAQNDACEATRVRGDQSEELLDLRVECLSHRLEDVRALTDLFAHADCRVVEKSVQAVAALPALDECSNAAALKATLRPPADAKTRADIESLRKRLAASKSLDDAGKYADALTIAAAAARDAKTLHYRPVEAEALCRLGEAQDWAGDARAAEQSLLEAASSAEASHHDEVAARAWIALIRVVGYAEARYDQALIWARFAEAAVDRLGAPGLLRASLLLNQGLVLQEKGEYEPAVAAYREAAAIRERALGPSSLEVAGALNSVGIGLYQLGRLDEAQPMHERALAIYEQALGREHPLIGTSLTKLGNVLLDRGRPDDALALQLRALAIRERTLAPGHPQIAMAMGNVGNAYFIGGHYEQALDYQRRALAIQEKALGPDNPRLANTVNNIGAVLLAQHRYEEALAQQRRALAIRQKVLGEKHADVALSLNNVGEVLAEMGKPREALGYYERAVAMWEQTLGKDHPELTDGLVGLGKVELALGAPEKAIAVLERAFALKPEHPDDPNDRAELKFTLARALWAGKRDLERARSLAVQARAGYAAAGTRNQRELREVDAWIGQHR
jgi:tetratricopeptide (TPR) repeat protein